MSGDRGGRARAGATGDRAGSELVGLVLLFGLVLVGAALVALLGTSAVDDVQQRTAFEAAETSFLDVKADLRTLSTDEDAGNVSVALPGRESALAVQTDGNISFTLNGVAACTARREMGTIRYTNDAGDRLSYQASAVWRDDEANATATTVSPPNLDYRVDRSRGIERRTLSFPLVNVNATESDIGAGTKVQASDPGGNPAAMAHDLCLAGPDAGKIDWVNNVTIRVENTSYYRAWGEYFRDEFRVKGTLVADVSVYGANQTAVAADVPLGTINDDDNDGYPDPTVATAANYPAATPGVDNCPPPSSFTGGLPADYDGSGGTTNYDQRNADGDRWGDPCDATPLGPGSGGGAGGLTVRFAEPAAAMNDSTAASVVADYEVEASDTNGKVDALTVALVNASNDSVAAQDDFAVRPNRSAVTRAGRLSVPADGSDYWLVAVARDTSGTTNVTRTRVYLAGPSDGDGDGVVDSRDDCPGVAGAGVNGCAPVDERGNALLVNDSGGTLTLLGAEAAETVVDTGSTRAPLDVTFVLDTSGSMGVHGHPLRRATAGNVTVPPGHEFEVNVDELDRTLAAGTHRVKPGQVWDVDGDGTFEYEAGETVTLSATTTVTVAWRDTDYDAGGELYETGWYDSPGGAYDRTFEPGETLYVYPSMRCDPNVKSCGGARARLEVDDPGNDPGFERVDAAESFIDELNASAGDRAAAIDFDSNARTIEGLTDDFAALKGEIDAEVDNGGGTKMNLGIRKAIDEYEPGGNERVMVLLSDGLNDVPDSTVVAAAEDAAARNITIYTVGLSDAADEPLMKQVAAETGGAFYKVSNATGLEQQFEAIASNVTSSQPVRTLERKRVKTVVNVGGNGSGTRLVGSDLNDPTAPAFPATSVSFANRSVVSLSTTTYRCAGGTVVGDVPHAGDVFNETDCDGTTVRQQVDNATGDHVVLTDGDPVPTGFGSVPWYADTLTENVDQYETATGETLTTGGVFDLDEDQAVFLLDLGGGNYTLLLFEADDSPVSTPGPDPAPTTTPSPPAGSGGSPADLEPDNGFVIDIDGSEVVVDESD